ncbi:MAG TPA: FG-GAP-like repeat-containing protein, partial [Gemmataceae bacterium]|nr:FG-GAP-like repeat-containing protein [Gemmataceae bacterium]
LAKADGSFQAGRNYPLAGGPIYLSEVDLNRDGKPDIIGLARILTNGTDISRAFVMLNRGDGTFQPPADYAIGLEFTGATQAVTGDFNGDGIPDLVVETYQPDLFFPGDGILSLGVLLGNVDGTLQKIQYSTVLPDQLNSVKLVAGDFNGDGMLDLARFGTRTDGTPVLETYLGKGDGTFEAPLTYTSLDNVDLRTEDILELATADFNGDGKLDLVLNNSTEKSVSVLLGNGDGSFEKPIDSAGANVGPSTSYATGDLNGDGKIDLVTANRDGTVSLLLGNGDGTFQQPLTYFNVLTGNAVFGPIPIVVADFNGDGVPDVGVLAGDRLAVLLNRRGHGPAQNVADAPLTATGTNHPATKDVTFLGTAAHFTDANPLATVGDFTATIAWGDGHTSPGTIMPDGNGGFTVLGSNVFSTTGTFAVTAVVEDRDGTGATVSGSVIVTAGPYTLLSAAGTSIAATARVAFTGTVSTFTSSDASVMAEDFTATITWGDGHTSPGFVRASASGGFEVQGVNTYAQPGNFAVTVAIVHTAGATTSTSGSAAVAPNTAAPLTATGATIAPTERILFTGLVATFIDGDPSGQLADYGALIDWGDGQFSTGTVTADQRIAGQFDVSGSHAYHQVGTLPVTVTLVSRTGARGTAIGEADIVAAPLTIHGLDLNPTEGAPFTGVVATFVDAIPFTAPSAYVATINWGDGHTSPGTVTADPQAAGMFDVAAGNTYARFGLYSITTTIEARGHATTAQALADVADAPLSVLGASINATAGSPYTGIVASFMDPNPAGAVGDYAATIFWGNGHISPGSITANAAGGFDVSGTNTYSDGGKSPVLVWIQDAGGASATVASTAIIVEPTGAITADMLQATEGMESLGVVAWFTAPPNRQLGDFAAVIDWGDGHATTGTFVADPSHVGQIGVQGTSTYAEEGQFTVAVTIATRGGVAATINSTAIVADAPLTAGGVPVQAVTGQTLTSIITTFIDTNAAGQLSDFTAQINWGDGQTSTGTITADPSMAGQFDVTGTVTYAQRGSFPVSVTVKDAGGANVVARSIAKVVVLPTAAGTSTTAQAGVPFNKVVATIADANPEDSPGDFTATIGWGDGYTTPGLVTLSSDGTNTFVVLGSATYVKEGESPVSIVLTRRDGLVLNASSSVTVGPAPDAPLFPLASIPVTAEQNRPATAVVALFRDSDVTATAADLTASINWGDGVSSSGIVVSAGTNSDAFIVVGSHTYTQPGAHLVTTAIEDVGGAVTSVSTGVVVTASQVSGLTARGTSLQSFERSQFKGTVASFTDAAAESQPADFTAAIDWGDGRTSSGNIIATGPGTFDVAADHTYLDETQFVIHVQIADHTGDSVTAQSSMTVLEELLPDGTRGTPNQRFVSELYRDLLRRHVEPGGLASWSGLLEAGVSRADVTLGIIKSPEYRTDVVEDLYHLYLHRAADPVGLHDDVAFLTSGGSQKQLAAFIVSSPEYYQSRAQGASSGYLDALYHDALNRSVDASGRSSFGAQLTAGVSRRDIADQIFNSPEYQIDLVRSIYFRYLDRDLDPSGLETWTALKKNVASDDYLLAQILGETVHHEFYDKTLR